MTGWEAPPPGELTFAGPVCALGESPVWDARLERLWWVDINGRVVWSVDPDGGDARGLGLAGRPGCLALTPDPEALIVAVEQEVIRLWWRSGHQEIIARLPGAAPTVRLNDGRVDAWGRLWTGTMHVPSSARLARGCLYRIDPDGSVQVIEEEVGVVNGLAFSPDGGTLYFADTHRSLVWRYPLNGGKDDPGPREVFLDWQAAGLPGRPDGACVDANGDYWCAGVYGKAVVRVHPDGTVAAVTEVPLQRPTCPAFGGADLTTMWVTSIGSAAPGDGDGPEEGRLIRWEGAGRGLPERHCRL